MTMGPAPSERSSWLFIINLLAQFVAVDALQYEQGISFPSGKSAGSKEYGSR